MRVRQRTEALAASAWQVASRQALQRGSSSEPPAQDDVLLGEHDPQAVTAQLLGRGQSGGAGAHHQYVDVIVHGFGRRVRRVGAAAQAAEAGGAAQQRLVDHLPGPPGRHEGLVVEARRQESRQQVVDRQRVKSQRGPAVLTARIEALAQLERGGEPVGFAARVGRLR